jgi:ADP-ribose pyrophosphatase
MNPSSSRHVLAEGNYLRLVTSDGWDYAERVHASGAVVVVAVTDDDRLLLTEQYRVPVAARVIELPAGIAGDEPDTRSEPLQSAARRELLEETGFEADELVELTQGPPSAGLSSEVVTFFHATGLRRVHQGGGVHREAIRVHAIPLDEVPDWLEEKRREGLLIDPKVYAGLHFTRSPSSRNDARQ